jgi:sugar phosphate permease
VAVISAALVLIGGTLLLIVQAQSPAALLLLVAVNQFLVQIYFGPLFDIPVRALGREFAGTISGFSNFWANIGALFSLYLLGSAKDLLGSFDAGFFLLAGMCAVAILLAVPVSRELTRRTTTTTAMPADSSR